MTSLEETFRTILAARLPDDPKWAAWIDGTVAELAASVPPQTIDRDDVIDVLDDAVSDFVSVTFPPLGWLGETADRILALVRPLEGAS